MTAAGTFAQLLRASKRRGGAVQDLDLDVGEGRAVTEIVIEGSENEPL